MKGSTAPDVYDLQQGGANTIQGQLANLDEDTVVGFGEQDSLVVEETVFGPQQLGVTMGSAILAFDTDSDGSVDGTLTLEGDYRKGMFVTGTEGGATSVRFQALALTPEQTQWVDADSNEISVDGQGLTRLLGDTAGKSVSVAEGSGVMNLAAGTQVMLEDVASSDVHLLRDGTTLLVIDAAGETLVQLATSTVQPSLLCFSDGDYLLGADFQQAALGLALLALEQQPDSLVWLADDGDRLMGHPRPVGPVSASAPGLVRALREQGAGLSPDAPSAYRAYCAYRADAMCQPTLRHTAKNLFYLDVGSWMNGCRAFLKAGRR